MAITQHHVLKESSQGDWFLVLTTVVEVIVTVALKASQGLPIQLLVPIVS